MRVLYFHQHFSTPKGAAGIRSYEMAMDLVRAGHKVTMVCGSFGPGKTGLMQPFRRGRRSGNVDGIDVIEYDLSVSNADGYLKRSWIFFRYAVRGIMVALRLDYDVLFATSTPLTAGIPGVFARWLRRKRFIFEVRDLWPELPQALGVIKNRLLLKLLKALEILICRSADRCIGLSPGIADGIARTGVDHSQISMIPNGCDLGYFQVDESKAWRPNEVGVNDFVAVYTGTHGVANGLEALIHVAAELQKRERNDIKLVLVGDGMMKPKLIEQARQLNLGNIIFLDRVDKIRLAGLMASAGVGIQCLANIPAFYFGTSPNKFFDYLSAGLPVICNYPGWMSDLIQQNHCGYAVPPEDAVALADAMEKAAANPAELNKMAENALVLARIEFDRKLLAKKWSAWVVGNE
jgi:glycosyltransferase involved in cell wall biosynthesis